MLRVSASSSRLAIVGLLLVVWVAAAAVAFAETKSLYVVSAPNQVTFVQVQRDFPAQQRSPQCEACVGRIRPFRVFTRRPLLCRRASCASCLAGPDSRMRLV